MYRIVISVEDILRKKRPHFFCNDKKWMFFGYTKKIVAGGYHAVLCVYMFKVIKRRIISQFAASLFFQAFSFYVGRREQASVV